MVVHFADTGIVTLRVCFSVTTAVKDDGEEKVCVLVAVYGVWFFVRPCLSFVFGVCFCFVLFGRFLFWVVLLVASA